MTWRMVIGAVVLTLAGCQAAPPAVVTPPPFTPATPRPTAPAAETRQLGQAVPVASPTATPILVGDYAALVRPRLDQVQQALGKLEQHLTLLQQAPIRMTQDDWRSQMQSILDDLANANSSLKALGARGGSDAALYAETSKMAADVDFVVDEYRLAFDFDPDGSHFLRATRAEKSMADEVESIRSGLQRHIGVAPTLTPAPAR
jgi:hypothetical protein